MFLKKLQRSLIHSCWPGVEEDDLIAEDEDDDLVEGDEDLIETNFCNGNNEMVKSFDQKCVICYEKYSVSAFTQCGHQCVCEQCYLNKGDSDILKCAVRRT